MPSAPARYSPAPGTDESFEKIMESVNEAMSGDPAASGIDEDTRRETIARALAKHGGKTYVPGPGPDDDLPDEDLDDPDARRGVLLAPDERTLRIPPMPAKPYWYEDPSDAELVDWYIHARRELGARMQGGLLITGPAGCLAGDTILHINRGGKGSKITIKDLVARTNGTPRGTPGGGHWRSDIPTRVARAVGDVIRLGPLAAAWESGIKQTYTLRTEGGREIRATDEHPFLTPEGWFRLGDLRVGMSVLVNVGRGRSNHAPKAQYRYRYTNHHPHQSRVVKGAGEFKVPEHRLAVEAEANDLGLDTFIAMLRTDPIRSAKRTFLDPAMHVHHLDGNPRNNALDNLVVLTATEHHRLHSASKMNHVLWQVGEDKIVSIEPFGEEMTYDIEVADDPHNFIANGFVVHNTGKTRGVVHAVERYNEAHGTSVPLLVMNCPTITDETKWFGRREADPEKGTYYVKSDFITAVESGAIILLDEFMRLHPRIHNPVMSLVDSTESVHLSELNLLIRRHPQTVFIGTTNIGSQFGGTHRMDWAMRERWSYTLERDFPPRDEEIKILATNNPGCDKDAAAILVDIAEKARQMWLGGDLRSPVSTRTLDNAAFLVASGFTELEALERTVIPEYDPGSEGTATDESERTKIKRVIEGRLGIG